MITVPSLNDTSDILDTDMVMVTHSDGSTEKISGADLNKRNQVIFSANKTLTGTPLKAGNVVRVCFTQDITGLDTSSVLQLEYNEVDKNVKVNKDGTLVNFVAKKIATNTYKYLQAYTVIEMMYDGTQFLVMGDPIVLSGPLYKIRASGRVDGGNIGDIKPISYVEVPYGWKECNGQAVSRTEFAELYTLFNSQSYDSDPTHTLVSRYGNGNGTTTFNLPDYREVALVGSGQNTTDAVLDTSDHSHDVYTVGEFKDDQLQKHRHQLCTQSGAGSGNDAWTYRNTAISGANPHGALWTYEDSFRGRVGDTTRMKSKGVKYIIKVL